MGEQIRFSCNENKQQEQNTKNYILYFMCIIGK
jgi:hypothetical protein